MFILFDPEVHPSNKSVLRKQSYIFQMIYDISSSMLLMFFSGQPGTTQLSKSWLKMMRHLGDGIIHM